MDANATKDPTGAGDVSEEPSRLELETAQLVYLWSWGEGVWAGECIICHNDVEEPCSKCQENIANCEDCPVSFGECKHAFHFHCIAKWLKSGAKTCPLDMSEWKYKE